MEAPELLVATLFLFGDFILFLVGCFLGLFDLFLCFLFDVCEGFFGLFRLLFNFVEHAVTGRQDLVCNIKRLRHLSEKHCDLSANVVGERTPVETGHAGELGVDVSKLALSTFPPYWV